MNMRTGRENDELRTVKITRSFTEMTPGSVLIEMGRTRVLCTVSLDDDVPPWMKKSGEGWVTAEYSMLPGGKPPESSKELCQRWQNEGDPAADRQIIARSGGHENYGSCDCSH